MSIPLTMEAPASFDTCRNFVRVTGERGDFVEFEFAIGEPELFIEMILTRDAFEDFCRDRKPVHLPPNSADRPMLECNEEENEFDWHLSDAREQRFRN
ncbi:phenol hydroxylase [Pseudoxanthomonas kalamensis DSM 18571]|uniref:phenol hydroxylase subunit n=1 Tax=Pseudoxanthomonas kalamensis TaxID=289483 RepID=UPI001390845F|nr:phenol hydroxylase subunit [Pseudoxanthomonas kalamensis]KAF1711480.1 phenol hydroxylase [Pseudoxanthomonas kalamensis DSM 18571]